MSVISSLQTLLSGSETLIRWFLVITCSLMVSTVCVSTRTQATWIRGLTFCQDAQCSPWTRRCVRCDRREPRRVPPPHSRSPSWTGTSGLRNLKYFLIVNIPTMNNFFYYNPIWNKIQRVFIFTYIWFHFHPGYSGSRQWKLHNTPCSNLDKRLKGFL